MARRKQKSKLAKLMHSDEVQLYETTVEDCKTWFNILNRELFDNSLYPIDEIDIRWRRKAYAWYEYNPSKRYSKLHMNKRYTTKQYFVEVLAHEMVHHYQAIYNEPLGHGPSFTAWSETFNKKGINLSKAY